jgi:CelD/BcsL family acetyltransferase involved in cellulose biosynthesis
MIVARQDHTKAEGDKIRIVVYKTEAQFRNLRSEWTALLRRIPSAGIYLTWEWVFSCWKVFGANCQLFLIAAYDGESLVGLAPFWISQTRRGKHLSYQALEYIPGCHPLLGADHLDLIVVEQNGDAVLGCMLQPLTGAPWDILAWDGIPAASPSLGALRARFAQAHISYRTPQTSICPYITLPDSWEDYLTGQCSPKFRRTIRHAIRRLETEHSISFIRADSLEDYTLGLEQLEKLHEERWGAASLFHQKGFRQFHEEVARAFALKDWLRIYVLRVDGRDVAVNYGFRYGSTFYGYQTGWTRDMESLSVGTVLLAKVIQEELVQGAKEIDLARGAEAYKFHWTSNAREEVRVNAYRPNWRGRVLLFDAWQADGRARVAHWRRSFFSRRQ